MPSSMITSFYNMLKGTVFLSVLILCALGLYIMCLGALMIVRDLNAIF